jgi:predicted alpha/beta hydrolase family esterase
MRLIIIPRWSGTPASDWYPWITVELNARQPQPFDPIVAAAMPNPGLPTISSWVRRVRELLGDDPA